MKTPFVGNDKALDDLVQEAIFPYLVLTVEGASGEVFKNDLASICNDPKVKLEQKAEGEAFKAMKTKEDRFIFFDSLSTLLIYNQSKSVSKFAHFLTGKMREWKIKGVLISLQKNIDENLIAQVSQFCDRIIEVK